MLQSESKQAIDPGRLGLHAHKFCAGGFEKLAILHTGRTSFETKPAVNTGQDFFLFSSESFSEY
jgi:hypothetical protein